MKPKLFRRAAGALSSGVALIIAVCGMSTVANAHHSFARFDQSNPATLSGTVKEFKMSNPHCWLFMMVPNDKGGTDKWSLEGPPANTLYRTGWTVDTLKPGMKIKVLIAPSKSNAPEAALLRLLEVDGKPTTVGTTSEYRSCSNLIL